MVGGEAISNTVILEAGTEVGTEIGCCKTVILASISCVPGTSSSEFIE